MAYAITVSEPGGPENFHRVEIEVPQPGAGEITLKHTSIGLNFIDVYFRTGLYPWPVERNLITGAEAAGVIEAVGPGVDLKPGQRVAYVQRGGAYASHRVIKAADVVPIPDDISDDIAASVMLKGLTVHYLLHHSYPAKHGETVLFHAAAGGVGLIAGQWLKAMGVRAIGTAGGARKCALAKDHGYAEVIDYKALDFASEVKTLTGGAGVDAVYDSVGADTVTKSFDVLKPLGTMVCFGQSSGPVTQFAINDLARGSWFLTRPTLFTHLAQPGWLQAASKDLFEMISSGKIRVEVGQSFALDEVADAHRALEGRQTTGSTILRP